MVRDQLPCRRERATSEDPFAVALMNGEMIVGYARDLARWCALQSLAHFLVSSLAAGLTVAD